jgi:aminoglycoside phosphotransferase (APT) family kinase protein
VHFCADEGVIGAPFYLMERIRGKILRRPAEVTLDAPTARRLSEAMIDGLIELHAIDVQAVGLADFGNPTGYVGRQVAGWSKRYRDAQTDDIAEMDRLAEWLAAHQPVSPPATILHNDYKHDNVVLDAHDLTRIVGILDWEMATIGDPLMDLGTMLCYWIEAGDPAELRALAFGPTTLPGSLTRRELAERYAERTGRNLGQLNFYYCFGLFKTSVVVQQIYYRYKQGLTHDERFAAMGGFVGVMARQAVANVT